MGDAEKEPFSKALQAEMPFGMKCRKALGFAKAATILLWMHIQADQRDRHGCHIYFYLAKGCFLVNM